MNQRLPIGYSDFAQIRRENRYYVDKTSFIREFIDVASVCLFTRPRRFGKTLNLSTLKYFYTNAGDYRDCFEGLSIMDAAPRYLDEMGQHPVIYLSLKEIREDSWELSAESFRKVLAVALSQHNYLLEWDGIYAVEQELFEYTKPSDKNINRSSDFLKTLSAALHRYHGQPAVILIDEYDAPILAAYLNGYYAEMIGFMRNFLGGGLKDNPHLHKAALTGIMRIAKESIFSGLNNLYVSTMLTQTFGNSFGFTVEEVAKILADFDLNGTELKEVHQWYNGYRVDQTTLFNPWSILQYVNAPSGGPRPFWAETSSNNLLKQLFFNREANIRDQLDALIRGEKLRKQIDDALIYPELTQRADAIWSLLLSAGYLKAEDPQRSADGLAFTYALFIPNQEIKGVYVNKIREWVEEVVTSSQLAQLLRAIREADAYRFEVALTHFAKNIFSFYDVPQPEPESFYHAFLLGLMVNLGGEYEVQSNRESGYGRFDLLLRPADKSRAAIVFELKTPKVRRGETVAQAADEAAEQLRAKANGTELEAQSYPVARWAIGVNGKEVEMREVA